MAVDSPAFVTVGATTPVAYAPLKLTIDTITAGTYTALSADSGKLKKMSSATIQTITLPAGIAVGTNIAFWQAGAGKMVFAAGTSASILNSSLTSGGTNAIVQAIVTATNQWLLVGFLAAPPIGSIGAALFSSTFTGTNGTVPTGFHGSAPATANASIQSNKLRLVTPATAYTEAVIQVTAEYAADSIETFDVTVNQATESYFNYLWRGNYGVGTQWLWVRLNVASDLVELLRLDPAETTIVSAPYTINNADVLHVKIYSVGTSIKIRAWKNAEAEPSTWLIEQTVTQYATNTARKMNALSGASATAVSFDVDNYAISTPATA